MRQMDQTWHMIDGTSVEIRPLTPIDSLAVKNLHAGLDQGDSYLRFFMPCPKDLTAVVASITAQDARHGSVGAFVGERLIGVANFVAASRTGSAEIAIVVAHDKQLHGVGTMLLRELRLLALKHHVRRFVADILIENPRMLQVLTDIGWPMSRRSADGEIHVELELDNRSRCVAAAS